MKLYVIIDGNYDDSYRAVQGAHAVAEWVLKNPESTWKNQTLVFLKASCLDLWKSILKMKDKSFVEFIEPDVGYKTTAIAILDEGHMFRKLELN